MSRKISDLHPLIQPLCLQHMAEFEREVLDILLVLSFTWRSYEEQDELYFLGRNQYGDIIDRSKVVTNARGGGSWHNVTRDNPDGESASSTADSSVPASLAYDILLLDKARIPLDAGHIAWQKLGIIGMTLGFDWGVLVNRAQRWDLGHFYMRGSNRLTLGEANSGLNPIVTSL